MVRLRPRLLSTKDRVPSTSKGDEDPERVRYGLVASAAAPNADEVETGERAVEVMVMWGDNAVLHVDHLNPIRSFYVGEAHDAKGKSTTDYLIGSELLGSERMPVVIDAGGSARWCSRRVQPVRSPSAPTA